MDTESLKLLNHCFCTSNYDVELGITNNPQSCLQCKERHFSYTLSRKNVTRLSVACRSASLSGALSWGLLLLSISHCLWVVCSCIDTFIAAPTKPVINFMASREKASGFQRLAEVVKYSLAENWNCLYFSDVN